MRKASRPGCRCWSTDVPACRALVFAPAGCAMRAGRRLSRRSAALDSRTIRRRRGILNAATSGGMSRDGAHGPPPPRGATQRRNRTRRRKSSRFPPTCGRNGRTSRSGSAIEPRRDREPGRYVYKWTISARGIFAWCTPTMSSKGVGSRRSAIRSSPTGIEAETRLASVNFDFDWNAGHPPDPPKASRSISPSRPGTQYPISIQIQVMLDLKNGNMPPHLPHHRQGPGEAIHLHPRGPHDAQYRHR